jgi:hypothetical protein
MGALVVLGKADLALRSDLAGSWVQIPHLTAVTPERRYDGTTVRFAGDTFPTAFSGEGQARTWQMQARYAAAEQGQLLALLDLIDRAAASADRALLLRTHYGQVAGLNETQAVVIFAVQPVPQGRSDRGRVVHGRGRRAPG